MYQIPLEKSTFLRLKYIVHISNIFETKAIKNKKL